MVRVRKACQKPKNALPTVTRFFKIMVHDDYLNVLVHGFAQNGMPKRALELIVLMQKEGYMLDMVIVVLLLPASTAIGNLRVGKSIHGYVLRRGLESYVNVAIALIDMYSKCGLVGIARLIFDIMNMRMVVSWNTIIDGYAQSGNSEEALELFDKMLDEKLKPSNVTVVGALHACADLDDLKRGQYIHELVNKLKLNSDIFV